MTQDFLTPAHCELIFQNKSVRWRLKYFQVNHSTQGALIKPIIANDLLDKRITLWFTFFTKVIIKIKSC